MKKRDSRCGPKSARTPSRKLDRAILASFWIPWRKPESRAILGLAHGVDAGDGTLCISPDWVGFYLRLGRPAPVAADGVALIPIDLTTPRRAKGKIVPGSTWRFQVWFSDSGGSKGYGFSEAIAIQFQ